MSKLYFGKMNLSKVDKTRLFEGKEGKWMDVTIWVNNEADQFGNQLSIQQSTKKDEDKLFLGNAKEYIKDEIQPPAQDETSITAEPDDLPF